MMKQVFFVLSLILFKNIIAQDMHTHIDSMRGISIDYPKEWSVAQDESVAFILIRPVESKEQVFRENINLVITSSDEADLGFYLKQIKSLLQERLDEYSSISTSTFISNGLSFIEHSYKHILNNYDFRVNLYLCKSGGKMYIFTCTAVENNFKLYCQVFKKCIETFRVL